MKHTVPNISIIGLAMHLSVLQIFYFADNIKQAVLRTFQLHGVNIQ
jgi:hypothetical protein